MPKNIWRICLSDHLFIKTISLRRLFSGQFQHNFSCVWRLLFLKKKAFWFLPFQLAFLYRSLNILPCKFIINCPRLWIVLKYVFRGELTGLFSSCKGCIIYSKTYITRYHLLNKITYSGSKMANFNIICPMYNHHLV